LNELVKPQMLVKVTIDILSEGEGK
jgi:hypothetical protein